MNNLNKLVLGIRWDALTVKNIDPLVGSAIITTAGSLVSGVGSAMANSKSYTKWRKSFDHARTKNIEDWNMVNEYNLPVNQVNRLLQAGINPNSMQISGQGGAISPASGSSMPQQNIAESARDIANNIAQTENIRANTKKTEAETTGQNIENQIASMFGIPQAGAVYERTMQEIEDFRKKVEFQEILNSHEAELLENQIKESFERGEDLRLKNLLTSETFEDLKKKVGYENAYLFAQTLLADTTREYIPFNAETGRISAGAQVKQAEAEGIKAMASWTQAQTDAFYKEVASNYISSQTYGQDVQNASDKLKLALQSSLMAQGIQEQQAKALADLAEQNARKQFYENKGYENYGEYQDFLKNQKGKDLINLLLDMLPFTQPVIKKP